MAPRAQLCLAELPGQHAEILPRVVEARPDGVERNALNAGDLLTGQAFDLEQHEGGAALLANLCQDGEKNPLVFLALEGGGGTARATLEGVWILDPPLGEDVLDPAAAAKVAHLPAGDPVEPAGRVRTVEGVETPAHHQEDLLDDVVAVGLRPAERADPARHVLEPNVVEGAKVLRSEAARRPKCFMRTVGRARSRRYLHGRR